MDQPFDRRWLAVALLAAWAPVGSAAETPRGAGDSEQIAALGRDLFENPMLSANREVSCATCHDAAKALSDGQLQPIGVTGIPVGRNSAALWGAGCVEAFAGVPSPKEGKPSSGKRKPPSGLVALTLEERCLAPIENPIEMGRPIDDAVAVLAADRAMEVRFDDAFGISGPGVTRERLGKALAAHVRSFDRPDTPYRRFVDGDNEALSLVAKEGLEVFGGRGRCNSCHSGPALSDGRVHRVRRGPSAESLSVVKWQLEAVTKRQAELALDATLADGRETSREKKRPETRAVSSYGGDPTFTSGTAQTLTLWGVGWTAPYFRDGAVADLEAALRLHVRELREVEEQRVASGAKGGEPKLPEALRPAKRKQGAPSRAPEALEDHEYAKLLAFLTEL